MFLFRRGIILRYSFIVSTLNRAAPAISAIEKLKISPYADDYECILATELGKARCRNLAINKSRGKYLIFIDGDSWCYPEILIWMMFWITKYPNDYLCYPHNIRDFCCSRILVISKELFSKLRGFNELYEEPMDIDFGLRALNEGIKIHYIPREWLNTQEHSPNKYVESIRRPFQLAKVLVHHPQHFWNLYGERKLCKFIRYFFFSQNKPFRQHYGIRNFIRFVIACSTLLINLLLLKIQPSFKSSLRVQQ